MVLILERDGEPANLAYLENLGLGQNLKDRDLEYVRDEPRFNFVGFVANEIGDLLVVMPKHFKPKNSPTNQQADLSRLFRLITRYDFGSTNRYIGSARKPDHKADYPFAAFYSIYEHYRRWGLDIRIDKHFKTSPPGNVNWRKTIQRGSWLPSPSGPIPFPVVYSIGRRLSTFLSECTVFAIDYTLERFGFLLNLESTGVARPNFDLGLHREYILDTLRVLRTQTFRDSTLTLIDGLISFFSAEHEGSGFYFKQYSFHLIWEEIVLSYLNRNFAGFGPDGKIQFQPRAARVKFKKGSFRLNTAYPEQALEPDYYAVSLDGKSQYILDAKYYLEVSGLNYKQFSYSVLLANMLDITTKQRRFECTYSALLLPSEKWETQAHFAVDPDRNELHPDVEISEEYLDIREVVEDYFRA